MRPPRHNVFKYSEFTEAEVHLIYSHMNDYLTKVDFDSEVWDVVESAVVDDLSELMLRGGSDKYLEQLEKEMNNEHSK
jgi:hypothetical protein